MMIENSLSNTIENFGEKGEEIICKVAIFARLFAFLFDNFISILLFAGIIIFFKINLLLILSDKTGFSILLFALFILHQFYFFIFEILLNGKTIGKLIFKIKVIDNKGLQPGLVNSFIRNFSRSIYFLPPFFFIPDVICLFLTAFKKRIGDAIAGTVVVKLKT